MESEPDRIALLVHELRSPVAALADIAEAVRDRDADSETVRELAGLAVRASQSIQRIVEQPALGTLRRGRIDLGRVVQDAVTAACLAGGRVRLSAEPRLELEGDPVRLRQVVDNLIQNARVHSGSAEEVVVRAERDEDFVLIAVSDAGRGIAPLEHERIFERGTRLDGPGAAAGEGLGLDIVRQIVEAHGGTVTVASDLGRGATFTVALPTHGLNPQAAP